MNSFFSDAGRELLDLLPAVPAILWALSFHEYCHGLAAKWCGDRTAEYMGRLTLNPLAHFNLAGTLCMFFFRFGWANPVPIDPRNFRRPRRDIFIVSAAGAAGNVLTAIAVGMCVRALLWLAPELFWTNYGLQRVLLSFVVVDLNFAVFNLLPIPPLDGAKILYPLLPVRLALEIDRNERWGTIILVLLIYTGVVSKVMSPVVWRAFELIVGEG